MEMLADIASSTVAATSTMNRAKTHMRRAPQTAATERSEHQWIMMLGRWLYNQCGEEEGSDRKHQAGAVAFACRFETGGETFLEGAAAEHRTLC